MLEIKNLSYIVNEEGIERNILSDVNIKIDDNEFVAITGPNGSGKSTLAKIIAGIKNPTAGSIVYNGQDITGLSITDRAKEGISYAFQQPVHFKGIKVRELLSLASGKKLKIAEAEEILSMVGLSGEQYLNRQVDASLSGGELKRIELATVFARDAKVLIFDEPEAGIDLWSFQNLIETFEKLKEKKNCSIIIISHQERIIKAADRLVLLSGGKIEKHLDRVREVL